MTARQQTILFSFPIRLTEISAKRFQNYRTDERAKDPSDPSNRSNLFYRILILQSGFRQDPNRE